MKDSKSTSITNGDMLKITKPKVKEPKKKVGEDSKQCIISLTKEENDFLLYI